MLRVRKLVYRSPDQRDLLPSIVGGVERSHHQAGGSHRGGEKRSAREGFAHGCVRSKQRILWITDPVEWTGTRSYSVPSREATMFCADMTCQGRFGIMIFAATFATVPPWPDPAIELLA